MISKVPRSTVFHSVLSRILFLTLVSGFFFTFTACSPEADSVDKTRGDTEVAGSDQIDVETSEMINSQSVGAAGAPHEKAVLGVQLLSAKGERAGECTAILIRDDAVLLAAHCFDRTLVPAMNRIIVHTNHDMNRVRPNDPTSREVTHWVIHPSYNTLLEVAEGMKPPHYDNDIAIAFLNSPFKTTRPQLLASPDQSLIPGMTLTTYGYGRAVDWTDSQRTVAAKRTNTRQRGTVTISDQMVLAKNLTTVDSKSSICQGDSGGPAYLIERGKPPVVVGLNSGSNGKVILAKSNFRNCRGQSVILPIAPFRNWIDQTLMENRR